MTHDEIATKVCEIINKLLAADNAQPHMLLRGPELGADSLDMVDIQQTIETEFDIEFKNDELNIYQIQTVGDVIRLVEAKLEKKESVKNDRISKGN